MASGGRSSSLDQEAGTSGSSFLLSSKSRRDKRAIATYLKNECVRANDPKPLNEHLDQFCDPSKPIDDPDTIDWYRTIIAGGMAFDDFSKKGMSL